MLLRGEPKSTMASSARDVVARFIAQGQSWFEAGPCEFEPILSIGRDWNQPSSEGN
jgi:hypothetical protein